MSVLRRIMGVIAGIAVGGIIVEMGDSASRMMVHVPKDFDSQNTKAMADLVANMPVSCFLIMIAGYIVAAFSGGIIATLITGREQSRPAMLVGILLTIGGVINLTMFPHPVWFIVVSTLVYIPSAWSGWRVIRKEPSA
ncbi:MAG: hypothetical protein JWO03_2553 [Bacteroidetes bacterium]|nr:hypothetical protein [Bacteroidota bacterium]